MATLASTSAEDGMLTTETQRGAFSKGTGKKTTKNMYDVTASTFRPMPDGPYEDPVVHNQPTAQDHFNAVREIKLRAPHGSDLPVTSYKDHYPPKEVPHPGEALDLGTTGAPFDALTEYQDQYFKKPQIHRPIDALKYPYQPGKMLVDTTTNQHFYKPFEFPPGTLKPTERPSRPATLPPPAHLTDWGTTYRNHYVPKDIPEKLPVGEPQLRDKLPWMAGPTTYRDHYTPKPLALVLPPDWDPLNPYPFAGQTEYQGEYVPKEPLPLLPPLTGVVCKQGLQLPLPRKSLGVEFWHKGVTDQYFVLIPRTMEAPCAARQIFTTVNDNQEQACILVLYGDDPIASNNALLGQFDIVNIPPAPKDVPRIEVTFRLDAEMFLTVEARDLDTARHKKWLQRGEIVVLRA